METQEVVILVGVILATITMLSRLWELIQVERALKGLEGELTR